MSKPAILLAAATLVAGYPAMAQNQGSLSPAQEESSALTRCRKVADKDKRIQCYYDQTKHSQDLSPFWTAWMACHVIDDRIKGLACFDGLSANGGSGSDIRPEAVTAFDKLWQDWSHLETSVRQYVGAHYAYEGKIDYYGKPTDPDAVYDDKLRYHERWPIHRFNPWPDGKVSCGGDSCVFTGTIGWLAANPEKKTGIYGTSSYTVAISRVGRQHEYEMVTKEDMKTLRSKKVAYGVPTKVGACTDTAITQITHRFDRSNASAPERPWPSNILDPKDPASEPYAIPPKSDFDPGVALQYENGGFSISYEQEPGVEGAKIGDPVRMCLVSIPRDCPPGDDRGRVYKVTNTRTGRSWTMADAQHMCGGA